MSEIPAQFQYTETHAWVRAREDGTIDVGITDHAQQALGAVVSVTLPDVGRILQPGDACIVVESVKTMSDVNSPVAGEVIAVNPILAGEPEFLNADPYGCWLIRIRPTPGAVSAAKLLSAAKYAQLLSAEGG